MKTWYLPPGTYRLNMSISVFPGEIEDNYTKFGGEGANKKLYYNVQIAKKSQVSALELSLSISCGC